MSNLAALGCALGAGVVRERRFTRVVLGLRRQQLPSGNLSAACLYECCFEM